MSDEKKQKYRVVRNWEGSGLEVDDVIEGPIHPALRSNVELVRGKKTQGAEANQVVADAEAQAEEILATANAQKEESAKVLDDARAEAEKIITDARAEADTIIAEAKAEAERIAAEASKPPARNR
jgi:vacuolar-type H+-ATPase subunit H